MKRLKHKNGNTKGREKFEKRLYVRCPASKTVFDGELLPERKCPNPECTRTFDQTIEGRVCPVHWLESRYTAQAR